MNKFIDLLAHTVFLEKQLGHLSPYAVNLNEEIGKKLSDSTRTGQCASFLAGKISAVSAYHVPDGLTEKKLRYLKNAHNKLLFLLEHDNRINTTPKNDEEKDQFEKDSIYRGGIRLDDKLIITTSGFHPVIDESFSLTLGLMCIEIVYGSETHNKREKWIKDRSLEFQNPYVLALCSLVNYVPRINYEKAMDWGLKEVGENFL